MEILTEERIIYFFTPESNERKFVPAGDSAIDLTMIGSMLGKNVNIKWDIYLFVESVSFFR